MSGLITQPLADGGPISWMAQALQARLQCAFSPKYFNFHFMPAKPDKVWFQKFVTRYPAVLLGWTGVTGDKDDGGIFEGIAHWTVALATRNSSSVLARYMGDNLAPGLFPMARIATVTLHGYLIDPPDMPWSASGSTIVNALGNIYNEDWGDQDTAVCALDVTVRYREALPPGLEQLPSNALLETAITWNFRQQPPLLTDNAGPGAD